MPKIKTNKTLQSRIKLTKNKKLIRKRAFTAHLRSKKSVPARNRTAKAKVEPTNRWPWNKLLKLPV